MMVLAPVLPHGGSPHWELLLVHFWGRCQGMAPPAWPEAPALWCGASCLHGAGKSPAALLVGQEPSSELMAPKGSLFLTSVLGAQPCLSFSLLWQLVWMCVSGGVCVRMLMSASVCLDMSLYLWEGDSRVFCFYVVFSLCVALCVAFKYEKCLINKVWFNLI